MIREYDEKERKGLCNIIVITANTIDRLNHRDRGRPSRPFTSRPPTRSSSNCQGWFLPAIDIKDSPPPRPRSAYLTPPLWPKSDYRVCKV
uniref:Uncharacterized protein n=1 Tax=Plectus sambesii TaxID=2011161 RepID=A0A914VQM5_9BILA